MFGIDVGNGLLQNKLWEHDSFTMNSHLRKK